MALNVVSIAVGYHHSVRSSHRKALNSFPGDPMSLKQRLLAFVAILLLTVIAALSGMAYWQMH